MLRIQPLLQALSQAAHTRGMAAVTSGGGPVSQAIVKILQENLQPTKLELVDDSAKHASHRAMKDREGGAVESHFQVRVVSDKFEGLSKVARHRLVYSLLDAQFKAGLHALNIQAQTPTEDSATPGKMPGNVEH